MRARPLLSAVLAIACVFNTPASTWAVCTCRTAEIEAMYETWRSYNYLTGWDVNIRCIVVVWCDPVEDEDSDCHVEISAQLYSGSRPDFIATPVGDIPSVTVGPLDCGEFSGAYADATGVNLWSNLYYEMHFFTDCHPQGNDHQWGTFDTF